MKLSRDYATLYLNWLVQSGPGKCQFQGNLPFYLTLAWPSTLCFFKTCTSDALPTIMVVRLEELNPDFYGTYGCSFYLSKYNQISPDSYLQQHVYCIIVYALQQHVYCIHPSAACILYTPFSSLYIV